jgi:CheY-like chemotaxis protein
MDSDKEILVVEDDELTRCALELMLVTAGYRVSCAGNGQEALEHMKAARPSLVLLDLSMPVMDGYEFRQRQRQDPTLAPVPVVVLSALPSARSSAPYLPAADCLQKPVDSDQLVAAVRRCC